MKGVPAKPFHGFNKGIVQPKIKLFVSFQIQKQVIATAYSNCMQFRDNLFALILS